MVLVNKLRLMTIIWKFKIYFVLSKYHESSIKLDAFVIRRVRSRLLGPKNKSTCFINLSCSHLFYLDRKMLLSGKILLLKCSRDQIANIFAFLNNIAKNGSTISTLISKKVSGHLTIPLKCARLSARSAENGLLSQGLLTAWGQNTLSKIISKN